MNYQTSKDYTLILLICLFIIALLTSCSPRKEVLYSRTIHNGIKSPWEIDVEGNPVKRHEFVFIDSLTGTVEFKYKNIRR